MSGAIQLLKKNSSGSVPLSAVLNSSTCSGASATSGIVTVVTDTSAVCTASGGSPGYTYQWAYISGATNIFITAATSLSTTFYTNGSNTFLRQAVFKCTVTDSVSGVAIATPNVTVTLENAP